MYCLLHSLRGIGWNPSSKFEERPELVSRLFHEQVRDYRQRDLAAAELRVHVPMIND